MSFLSISVQSYRNGASSAGHFGNGDLSVDVDGPADVERKFFAELAVDVENDAFSVHPKVNFVPFFIKDLNASSK